MCEGDKGCTFDFSKEKLKSIPSGFATRASFLGGPYLLASLLARIQGKEQHRVRQGPV